MSERLATCALCPRLCRPACPVTTATAREAAVPTWLAQAAIDAQRGLLGREDAIRWLSLCTDCGACETHCHIHHPLPDLLREARQALAPEAPPELPPIEGEQPLVVVESDARPLARALSTKLGREVARWATPGLDWESGRDGAGWGTFLGLVRERVGNRTVVAADGAAVRTLTEAGCVVEPLTEHVSCDGVGSCRLDGAERPIACCGGGGPLARHHAERAGELGRYWVERAGVRRVVDARCRAHLASLGEVTDAVDQLLEELGWAEPTPS